MTQTIEQLTARVRELEEENARLHEQVDLQIPAIAFKQLTEQLAASQAYAEQLREALENHSGNYTLTKAECKVINDLLDQPTETSALDAYVAEKVKEYQKHNGILGREVKELTRQRDNLLDQVDLAVEALEKYATPHVRLCHLWACEALSSIKESEK